MKVIKHKIKADYAYLLPISDLHIGDKSFDEKKLQGYLDWVKKEKNARVFLNGDILNVATRISKSSPFEQNLNTKEQLEKAVKLFSPIKDKILGAISGNHEQRLEQFIGYNPLIPLCESLGIKWCNYSAILRIDVISKKFEVWKKIRPSYTFYCHHTVGGASTVGGKLNRVAKLKEIVSNVDCYIGSHNHQLAIAPVESMEYSMRKGTVEPRRQLLIDSGSFLKWNEGYAEKSQLQPAKLGTVRIRMDGDKKDIHCDL